MSRQPRYTSPTRVGEVGERSAPGEGLTPIDDAQLAPPVIARSTARKPSARTRHAVASRAFAEVAKIIAPDPKPWPYGSGQDGGHTADRHDFANGSGRSRAGCAMQIAGSLDRLP